MSRSSIASPNDGSGEHEAETTAHAGAEALQRGNGGGCQEDAVEVEHVGCDNAQNDEEVEDAAESRPGLLDNIANRIILEMGPRDGHGMQPRAIIQMELTTEPA